MNYRKLPLGTRNIIGKKVTEARNNLGITQIQLMAKMQLEEIDITISSMSLLEGQKRPVFDYELKVLAKILNVDVNWLLGD